MDVKVFFVGVLGRIMFIRVVLIEIVWWIKIRGINVDIVDLGSVFALEWRKKVGKFNDKIDLIFVFN